MQLKGTDYFVKALIEEGVDTLFGYPGGYAIDIFDALYGQNEIEVILPRHEQGLIHEAEGYARSTGKVGVCLVTSGPGATNLITGIADANYDSTPLVCFTGQVPTQLIGNDAFQEVDIVGITRSICKWGVTVRSRKQLGQIIKEAFYVARTGKPGPVIVDLPKDVMLSFGDDSYPTEVCMRGYKPQVNVHPVQLKRGVDLLMNAKKPLFLIGGGVTISHAKTAFTTLAEQTNIPVITTIMGKGCIPTNHPLYVGNVGMHGCYAANQAISECDVLFSIGTRFNDRITGKLSEFAKGAKIVHIDIDSSSISRNIKVDVPIVADAKLAIEAMQSLVHPCETKTWLSKISAWKEAYPISMSRDKGITPQKIIEAINKTFENPIVATDVGQHQMWTTQYLQMSQQSQLITSGGLGTMGFGLPASIGAKIGNPDRTVLCITGDGGFQMNIQELATAATQQLPIIICIFNNSYLGMVRQWQQLMYDKRYSSTCTRRTKSCSNTCKGPNPSCPVYTPDFVSLAASYGALGIRITEETDIIPALKKAKQQTTAPAILEFIIDSEELVLPMVPGGNALNHMILEC